VRAAEADGGALAGGARERGKSDPIDAQAVARAALSDGLETLPAVFLDEAAFAIKRSFGQVTLRKLCKLRSGKPQIADVF